MKQDRYDEFYILQTQAKGLEKRGRSNDALKIYLQIIEDYFPDTDFSFERSVILLEKNKDFKKAKEICQLAIERISAGEMRGTKSFFDARIQKIEEKTQEVNTPVTKPRLKDKKFLIPISAYLLFAVILTLPDKLYKFAFIFFLGVMALLVLEIAKRIKEHSSIKLQSIALFIATFITASAALQIPPPQWTHFFSLQSIMQMGQESIINQSGEIQRESEVDATITQDDMDTLEKMFNHDLIIESYSLSITETRIELVLFLKASATKEEAKEVAFKILKELNAIKGFKSDEDRLGDLYKEYNVSISAIDSTGKQVLSGTVSKFTQKIKW